ncbi:MAG TPA: T9SS type A sorting domain-containing protein [Candidatus Kapabacteria bacterium]|nr:T9SS type A sorting domain-containing protein [Candidatus Kapabacteria bacterium]
MKKLHILIGLLAILFISTSNLRAQNKNDEDENEGTSARDRIEWYYMQRAYPNGIPVGARLKALRIARSMTGALKRNNETRTQSTTWQPLGPSNSGGRIEAIAVDPSTSTLYVGASEGGVWRGTTTTGSNWTWTPLTDKADALAMGALAIDPTNTQTIYAGTGEWNLSFGGSFTDQSPIYAGAGMLKSTDGGTTWTNIGLTNTAAFSRIIVNPDNHNIIWAAGFNGLYRSSDAGSTWTALIPDSLCCDLALDPNDHTRLYVAIQNRGVFGVVDPTPAMHAFNGFPQDTTVGRIAITAANNGGQTVVYAAVAQTGGTYKGIYKLSGGGWSTCATPSPNMFTNSQGWYDITIAASPFDANTVIVGGDVYEFHSANGGSSWSVSSIGHPDHHAILFDPVSQGVVYEGNDGGIFVSQDDGSNFSDISNGLAITQFYGIDVDQTQSNVTYGGTQDNGSWAGGSSASWNAISGGDGGATKLVPNDNQHLYLETLANRAVYYAATNGSLASQIFSTAQYGSPQAPWVEPIAVDPSNVNKVYVGTDYIWASGNSGASFSQISPDLTRASGNSISTISAIAVSPTNPSIIWSGSNDGLIFVSTSGGGVSQSAWNNVSVGLPGRTVTRIVPISDNTAYATFSGFGPGHVMETTNQGATWVDLSSNLPDIPVSAFAIDPTSPTHLFIGTDVGVFYSIDGGGSWVPYMDGLPNVVVNELVVQKQTNMLYAGTYGRSVWKAPMNAPVIALGSPVYGPVWYTNQTYPIVWYGIPSANISYSIDNGNTWIPIDQAINAPSYQWDIPGGINTTQARIKVESGSATLISDPFTIRPPKTGDVIQTIAIPFVPYSLTFDGYNLWSTSFLEKKIYKLDPDLLSVRATIPAPADSCTGIAYAPDTHTLYVHQLLHNSLGIGENKIYHIDTLGNIIATFNSPASTYATGLAYDGVFVFAVDRDVAKIYAIDPTNGSLQQTFKNPVGLTLGPRGMTHIGNDEFLHLVTLFNPSLSNTYLYRLKLDSTGAFVSIDTTTLSFEGSVINGRGIEKDSRYPNSYWVSDYGTGTSGSIYRIVGFDLQSLDIVAPAAGVQWIPGTTQNITWTSLRVDTVNITYSTDNGTTWMNVASGIPASTASYAWNVPNTPSVKAKVRIAGNGANATHSTSSTFTIGNGNAVSERSSSPDGFVLYESHPNPFQNSTNISFTAPHEGNVTLSVYDESGKLVQTLIDGVIAAGEHSITFNANGLPSGVYTYELRAGATTLMRSMVVTK